MRLDHVGPLRRFLAAAADVRFTSSALVFDRPVVLDSLRAYVRASTSLDAVAGFRSLSSAGTSASAYTLLLLLCAERFRGVADLSDVLVYQLMQRGVQLQAAPEQAADCIRGVLFYCAARMRFNLKRQQLHCAAVPLNMDILMVAAVKAVMSASRLLTTTTIVQPIPLSPAHPSVGKLCRALREPATLTVLELASRYDGQTRLETSMGDRMDLITSLCFVVMCVIIWGSDSDGDGGASRTRACLSALGSARKLLRILSSLATAWRGSVTPSTDYPAPEDIGKVERAMRFLTVARNHPTHPAVLSLIYQGIILQLRIMYTLAPTIDILIPLTNYWNPLQEAALLSEQLTEWQLWRLQGCRDCVLFRGLSELENMRRAGPCLLCGRRIFCHAAACENYRAHLEQQCTGTRAGCRALVQDLSSQQ